MCFEKEQTQKGKALSFRMEQRPLELPGDASRRAAVLLADGGGLSAGGISGVNGGPASGARRVGGRLRAELCARRAGRRAFDRRGLSGKGAEGIHGNDSKTLL